jgi:hypothetical protein
MPLEGGPDFAWPGHWYRWQQAPYILAGVCRVLAVLIAMMLAVATTADRVACPDGCKDEAQHETSTTTPWACGLCHGWTGSGPAAVGAPVAHTTRRPVATAVFERSPHLTPIDHPPRFA